MSETSDHTCYDGHCQPAASTSASKSAVKPAHNLDPGDVELVARKLPEMIASVHGCLPADCDLVDDMEPDEWRRVATAVLSALATEGRLRRTGPGSAYVQGDERPCGDPHPEGGLPCQLPPGHDSHARPASGGFDAWRPAPDEGRLLPPDAETEWAVRLTWPDRDQAVSQYATREQAERKMRGVRDWPCATELLHRRACVGQWLPVPETKKN